MPILTMEEDTPTSTMVEAMQASIAMKAVVRREGELWDVSIWRCTELEGRRQEIRYG